MHLLPPKSNIYRSGKSIVRKSCAILISIYLLNGSISAQSSGISEKLLNYDRAMVSELIYIQTDRDVYYKGDTIWFKSYIRKNADLGESNLSQVFNISLVSDQGVSMINRKYIQFDSQVQGQFYLDRDMKEGCYYLTAFTSWMQNFGFEDIYKKRIFIRDDDKKHHRITPYFNQAGYNPGDDIAMKIASNDDYDELPGKLEYKYKVEVDGDKIQEGDSDNSEIKFHYDTSFQSAPTVAVRGRKSTPDLDAIIAVPANMYLDIAFYPEGGHCINGLPSKIAFKAMYSDGRSASLSGRIVDDQGMELNMTFTEHEGMGVFLHTPDKNRTFYFIPDQKSNPERFELPHGEDQGWQMKANFPGEELLEIEVHNPSIEPESGFLLLQIRKSVVFCKPFQIEGKILIRIPTDSIPEGVGVFTILDSDFKPQCERLAFINYQNRNHLKIWTDSLNYRPRDSTVIHLTLKDKNNKALKGQFSITAYNEKLGSRKYFEEPDILSSFYLLPEVKNYIHNPGYYFHTDSLNAERYLDLLLMTQGWRNYAKLHNADSLPLPCSQEQIKGNITRYSPGKGMVPTKGSVKLQYCGNETIIKTNNTGFFIFNPIFEKGYNPDLVLSVIDNNDKRTFELNLDMNEYLFNYMSSLSQNISSFFNVYPSPIYTYDYLDQNTFKSSFSDQFLGEVKLKTRRKDDMTKDFREQVKIHPSVEKVPEGIIYTSKDIREILKKMGIVILPQEFGSINDKVFMPGNRAPHQYAIIGFVIDQAICNTCTYDEIRHLGPEKIDEIFIGRGFDQYDLGFGGLNIYIFTKNPQGCPINSRYFKSDAYIDFDESKEFYHPKYPSEFERKREYSDFRRTIFWKPDLIIDESGQARISFFNADQNARIKCVVEGFGENNLPIKKEFFYHVHD